MSWVYDGPEFVSSEGQRSVTFKGGPLDGQTHGRASNGPYYLYTDADDVLCVYQTDGEYIGNEIPKEPEYDYDDYEDYDDLAARVASLEMQVERLARLLDEGRNNPT